MNEMNNIPQSIVDRIHKLLSMKDKAATPAEAENAARRIQEILIRYNLELAQVEAIDPSKKKKVGEVEVDLNKLQAKTEADWVMTLYNVIARHNLCRVIKIIRDRKKNDQGGVSIIGKSHNIEIVSYTVSVLIPMIRKAEKSGWNTYTGYEKRNTYKRGFLLGCVSGIAHQLEQASRELQAQHNTLTSLMVINNTEIAEYVEEKYEGNLIKGRSGRTKSQSGYQMGQEAGAKMPINKGLTNNEPKAIITEGQELQDTLYKLSSILSYIPESVMSKWQLTPQSICRDILAYQKQHGGELELLLAANIPYYINYGKINENLKLDKL